MMPSAARAASPSSRARPGRARRCCARKASRTASPSSARRSPSSVRRRPTGTRSRPRTSPRRSSPPMATTSRASSPRTTIRAPPAAEVFKAAGRGDIKVVGTGGTINGLKAIREGLMYGTMDQSPTTECQAGARLRHQARQGRAVAAEAQHHPDAQDHLDQRRPVQGRVVIGSNLPAGGARTLDRHWYPKKG